MDLMQSEKIDLLAAAIVKAQLCLQPAKKDATNPFFHSKYADLPAVWEAVGPFLAEGIAITQLPMDSPDGFIVLDTQLTHVSGQWMRGRLKMRLAKDDPQGSGSGITYARRYSLGCMTGVVTDEDDDGNAASKPQQAQKANTGWTPSTKPLPPSELEQQLKASIGKVIAGKPVSADPGVLLPQGDWKIPFGKNKGRSLTDVMDEDLDYLIKYYTGKLKDPANSTSRYREEWEQAVLAVRAELLQRFPDSQ